MAAHQSYEDQKKLVFKGLMILGVITIVEVFVALFATFIAGEPLKLGAWAGKVSAISRVRLRWIKPTATKMVRPSPKEIMIPAAGA